MTAGETRLTLPETRRLHMSEVELIDIGPLVVGEAADETLAAIESACLGTGFFYVCNHGVAASLVNALHEQAQAFFALPMEQRLRLRMGPSIRGYLPLNYHSDDTDSPGGTNLQEGFWMGLERPVDPACPFDGPNVWPPQCPGLRPAMEAYFRAAEGLACILRRAFSTALGLGPARLDPLFEHAQSRLKLNHYPAQTEPRSLDEIGVVPHTDTGAYTILWQDSSGGLEIRDKHGEWVAVPPIAETFVINLGNTMQTLTGGRFASTPHRVINRSGGDRYSIAFFANPGHQVTIAPLLGDRTGFEPFNFGAYQRKQYRGIYPVAFE